MLVAALIDHGLKAAGTKDKLLTESAFEILWRAVNGVPRDASRLLRAALKAAHRMNQNLVDDHAIQSAIDELIPRRESTP